MVTVRVKTAQGISRVTADTVGQLQEALADASRYGVPPSRQVLSLRSDNPAHNELTDPSASLEALGVKNGDYVYARFLDEASLPQAATAGVRRPIATGEEAAGGSGSGASGSAAAGPSLPGRSREMDISKMTEEYERSILRLRPQFTEARKCAFLAIDRQSIRNFHDYVHRTAYQTPRMGYLIGYENEFEAVEVHCIWEPPQDVGPHGAVEFEGQLEKAIGLAAFLGMKPVGWVFTVPHERDKAKPLTAYEVHHAATLQRQFGSKFCTLIGSLVHDESGKTQMGFEVFQCSEQCLQVLDQIAPEPSGEDFVYTGEGSKRFEYPTEFRNQEIMGGSADELHDKADPTIFLVPLPIVYGRGKLVTNFPVENRNDIPQEMMHLKELMTKFESYSITQRLADFHVLWFLSTLFELPTMEPICEAVNAQDPELMGATKELIDAYTEAI